MAMVRKISGREEMKGKNLVLVVVCSLLAGSANLMAKERRGAEVVITKTDGQQVKGELIAVKPTSLLLLDAQSGGDVSIAIKETETITIIKPSKIGRRVGWGALIGLGCGILFAAILGPGEYDPGGFWLVSMGIGTGTGAGIGAMIAGIAGQDIKYEIRGVPNKEIMEKLRRKARVPDAQ